MKNALRRPCERTNVCTHLERQSQLSSLRTQGPIPRDICCRKESRPAVAAKNDGLWLWVPASRGRQKDEVPRKAGSQMPDRFIVIPAERRISFPLWLSSRVGTLRAS